MTTAPATLNVRIRSEELRHLIESLNRLGPAVSNKHLRIGLSAAGGKIRDAAKMKARRQTGLLRRSLAVVVTVPRTGSGTVKIGINKATFGVYRRTGKRLLGARAASKTLRDRIMSRGPKLRAVIKKQDREWLAQQGDGLKLRRPVHYAHLVERGHKKGKGKSAAPPYPFLRPALEERAADALRALTSKLREGLAKELAARKT